MDVPELLYGRSAAIRTRLLAIAHSVFIVVFVLYTPSEMLGFELPYAPEVWSLFLLAAALPIFGAFVNDGLLVSVALAAAPAFGFYLPLTLFNLMYPSESVLWDVGTASMFALPLGLLGFVIGAGARRLVEYVRPTSQST